MKAETRKTYLKNGRKWELRFEETDPETIHKELLDNIVAKKMHNCSYIKSIKESCNYDGTRTFTVYFSNDTKAVYIIEMR